ncbi:MAG: glutamyl-tRNA reductase [Chloroflexi bacterium]|nr:glutamyl-tRNA reductase [Chloroflexota bacterium]
MLLCLSLSARDAPLEVREPFAVQPDELPQLAAYLRPHVSETLLLSTCQRFEAYVVPRGPMAGECVAGLIAQYHQADFERLQQYARFYQDREAAAYLFRVAAGLESQVLGEAQILGQLRRSLDAARQVGMIDRQLGNLVQQAVSAGRRVRQETALGRGALSVPWMAVEQARRAVGHLSDKTVLLIGAGETAQLAARALDEVGRRLVVNRTLRRAQDLADERAGTALPWNELPAAVAEADLVLCCTGSEQPPLTRRLVGAAQRHRPNRALTLVDLAVPRGVEHGVTRTRGVRLITLDDLREQSAARQALREREIPLAEQLVAEDLERAWRSWLAAAAVPAVTALRQRAEEIREHELERLRPRFEGLPAEQAEAVQYLTRAIVNKLLHEPTLYLKTNPTIAESALREVFGIGVLS